jgi:hypothetical protein
MMNCTGSVREFVPPQLPKVKISSHGRRVPLPASIRNTPLKSKREDGAEDAQPTIISPNSTALVQAAVMPLVVVPVDQLDVAPVIPTLNPAEEDDYISLEVLRHRYALFVREMSQDADQYHSPTVLAETILRKMLTRTNVSRAQRVAAATWALEILSMPHQNDIIRSIRNELIPAVYMDYDPAKLYRVTASVHPIVSNPSLLSQNPIFSHNMYLECRDRLAHEAITMNRASAGAVMFQVSRKNAVHELINRVRLAELSKIVYAWRKYVRDRKVERVVRRNSSRRMSKRENWMLQQISFQSWRSFVERSRSTVLAEKLHNAQGLLDNAKNQFQIQCYRSDKHLRTVEELRLELDQAHKDNETTKSRLYEADRAMQTLEEDHLGKMNDLANKLLIEMGRWKQFARYSVEALSPNTELYAALRTVAESESPDSAVSVTVVPSDDQIKPSRSGAETDGEFPAQPAPVTPKTTDPSAPTQPEAIAPDRVLLCWVQGILRELAPHLSCRNFATDFRSGEVMILVLHHLAPQEVSLASLQESSVKARIEKVVSYCQKLGLAHIPRARDFQECNSDVIFVTVADVFCRYVDQLTSRKASQLMSGLYTDELLAGETSDALSKVVYDISMLPSVLAESREELMQLSASETQLRRENFFLVRAQDAVTVEAAFLTRERLEGNPVRAVGKVEVEKYYKMKSSKLADLEPRYTARRDEPWKDQLTSLRLTLEKHVYSISRLFKFYSGFSTNLHEHGFWRLATGTKLFAEKSLSKRLVEKVVLSVCGPAGAADEESSPADVTAPEPTAIEEILPAEFTEILIRLADVRGGPIGPKTALLAERFESLIQFLIKAHTKHLTGPENQFRREFNDLAVQKVLSTYAADLGLVFRHYCSKTTRFIAASTRRMPLLDIEQLHQMLRDAGIEAEQGTIAQFEESGGTPLLLLTSQQISQMLQLVVEENEGKELNFFETVELLASLSVYRIPNPFATLDRKVDVVLSHALIKLRGKLRGFVALSEITPATLAI